jgi:hypothetical protein
MFNEALKSMKTSCLCFYQCCCLCFLQPPHIGIRILKVVGRNEKVKHLFTTCRLTQKYYLSLLFNIPWNYNSIFYIYAFVLSTFFFSLFSHFFFLSLPSVSFTLHPRSHKWIFVTTCMLAHTLTLNLSLTHTLSLSLSHTHTYIHNYKTLRCFKM